MDVFKNCKIWKKQKEREDKMTVDDIITLEDDMSYELLLETTLEGDTYFMACRVDENDEPLEEFVVFKKVYVDGDESVLEVDDPFLLKELHEKFEELTDELE